MSPTNVFYYRAGTEDGINHSFVKFDLADSLRDPHANGIACSAALDGRNAMSTTLRETLKLLERYGLRAYVLDRIRHGKQFAVGTAELPIDEISRIGWRVKRYPNKYRSDVDRDDALVRARRYGLHIDASNLILNRHNIHGGLALLAVINWCKANGVKWHIYFDHKTWGGLKKKDRIGYDYFQTIYRERVDGSRRFCTPKRDSGLTADDLMFDYANGDGGSILSRDTFDERDYLGWPMTGAEDGRQRLHKFWTDSTSISVPDIGLYAIVPTSY